MNCIQCGAAIEGPSRFCADCRAGVAASPRAGTPPQKPVRLIWILLVLFGLIGTYAAVLIPAFVGRQPDSTGTLGSIFWTGLLFFLLWKRLDKTPWTGAAIGGVLGFLVVVSATVVSRGREAEAATPGQTDDELLLALGHFDPAGADSVRRHWSDKAMVQRRLQPLLQNAIRTASDDAILRLADAQQRTLDPELPGRVFACSDAARGVPPSLEVRLLPEEERAVILAMAEVFRTADARRDPPAVDIASLQRSVLQVYAEVDAEGVLRDPERLKVLPPHEQCALYRTFTGRIRSLPEAAALLRYSMMSRQL
jgi:hypothetical protein